jgi:hypothetical protein
VSRAWKVKKLDPEAPLAINARRILAVRIAEFYTWESIVQDDSRTEQLHQLRISAKRLRYTLELFRDEFGETGERNIERVREVQDVLGRFHDHDVRIALIEDELRALALAQSDDLNASLAKAASGALPAIAAAAFRPPPDDPRRGLVHLLSRQYESRIALLGEFRALWAGLRQAGMRAELVHLSAIPVHSSSQTS